MDETINIAEMDKASSGPGTMTAWHNPHSCAGATAPPPAGCVAWRKRRLAFCGEPRTPGEWFCAVHCDGGEAGRVPCPLDPRHSVRPAQVASHMQRCQRAPGRPFLPAAHSSLEAPWICPGVNKAFSQTAPCEDEQQQQQHEHDAGERKSAAAAAALVASKDPEQVTDFLLC